MAMMVKPGADDSISGGGSITGFIRAIGWTKIASLFRSKYSHR